MIKKFDLYLIKLDVIYILLQAVYSNVGVVWNKFLFQRNCWSKTKLFITFLR